MVFLTVKSAVELSDSKQAYSVLQKSMLFNSFEFILLFLPVTLLGFYGMARWQGARAAAGWLTLASLFFYAWWDMRFLPLLLASIALNFGAGIRISRSQGQGRKTWLTIAVTLNLCLLAYFKYADFFVASTNSITGSNLSLPGVLLPIGISFFTFTQIAYLVDTYKGLVREFRPLHYALFVTYFPHLIAGPVLHHGDMMPQFARQDTYRLQWDNIAFGLTLFILGLGKKVLLADELAIYVPPVFDAPHSPMFIESWAAAITYTLQLYFDFSGYSDMAVGLSRLFGISLPINFNSPYKAGNIIEFWRRWHMTLSRFLRDYLYFALGGNRHGVLSRYRNLMLTMVLGGLWHGAAWTFVFWGFLHGLYLAINHGWQAAKSRYFGHLDLDRRTSYRLASQMLCFVAVVIAWVFFRAHGFEQAREIIRGMTGANGAGLPYALSQTMNKLGIAMANNGGGHVSSLQLAYLSIGSAICFFAPNSMEILAAIDPGRPAAANNSASKPLWRLSRAYGAVVAMTSLACLLHLTRASEFLYFQF